jgi:hypothetical protein
MAYFMHRIQFDTKYQKGIEVHETLDAAILSFWGRMKTAFNNPAYPNMKFVSCKITDNNGNTIEPYDITWNVEDKYFLHHIKFEGNEYTKDIDVCDSFDEARCAYATYLEYGYNNSKFPNVKMVSCEITDGFGSVVDIYSETWNKPEPKPEPEPEPTPEPEEEGEE